MPVFEDHRLRRPDLTIIHDSSSIGAGPDVAFFQKLKDCAVFSPAYLSNIGPASLQNRFFFDVEKERDQTL